MNLKLNLSRQCLMLVFMCFLLHLNSIDLDHSAKVGSRSLYFTHIPRSPVPRKEWTHWIFPIAIVMNKWDMCSLVNNWLKIKDILKLRKWFVFLIFFVTPLHPCLFCRARPHPGHCTCYTRAMPLSYFLGCFQCDCVMLVLVFGWSSIRGVTLGLFLLRSLLCANCYTCSKI